VGVTKGTVSIALSQLRARGLIRFDAARFPVLTPAGLRVAADVRGRYAIVQAFLVDVLGLAPERASSEACRWEHVVSHEVADRLLDLLRFAGESPRWEAALAEFQSFHRRCSAGSLCTTCRAKGPVESYCHEPLVLPTRAGGRPSGAEPAKRSPRNPQQRCCTNPSGGWNASFFLRSRTVLRRAPRALGPRVGRSALFRPVLHALPRSSRKPRDGNLGDRPRRTG